MCNVVVLVEFSGIRVVEFSGVVFIGVRFSGVGFSGVNVVGLMGFGTAVVACGDVGCEELV